MRRSGGVFPSKTGGAEALRRGDRARPRRASRRPPRPDAAGARRRVPRAARDRRVEAHDPDAPGAPLAAPGRLRTRAARRPRTDDRRDRRVRRDAARAVPLLGHVGAPADVRGGRPLRLHDEEPGEARGQEPAAAPPRCVACSRRTSSRGSRTSSTTRARPRSTFAAATGLRPAEWASIERQRHRPRPPRAHVRGTKTLRSSREVPLTAAALAALDELVPRLDSPYVFAATRRRPVRRRQLPPAGVGASDRSGRDRDARPDLRPPLDVRSNALAAGDHRVRARPDHGHVRRR